MRASYATLRLSQQKSVAPIAIFRLLFANAFRTLARMCDLPVDPLSKWQESHQNINDAALAELLNCNRSTVSRLKSGETSNPRPDLMDRITAVTGVTPNEWAKFRHALGAAKKNCRKRRKEPA